MNASPAPEIQDDLLQDTSETVVPSWPRVTASTSVDPQDLKVEVILKFVGPPITLTVPAEYFVRGMVLSYAYQHAKQLRRPVSVVVNPDSDEAVRVAVRPSGVVQELDSENRIEEAIRLLPAEFPCLSCSKKTPITGSCASCGADEPFLTAGGVDLTQVIPADEALEQLFPGVELHTPGEPDEKPLRKAGRFRVWWIPAIAVSVAVQVAPFAAAVWYFLSR